MKKYILASLLLIAAFSSARSEDGRTGKAIYFLRLLNSDASDIAYEMMDSTMKALISKPALSQVFPQLSKAYGKLNADSSRMVEGAKISGPTVFIPLRFEKTSLMATVSFDATPERKISGLYIKPYSEGKYSPPNYADTNKFVEKEVRFGDSSWELPAILTIPDGVKNPPCVILVHGSGAHDYDETIGPNKPFKDLAWGLATLGVASLRYDKRTFAHTAKMSSVVKKLDMNFETIDDAVLAYQFLKERSDVGRDKIFILGHSQGGYAMPRIASKTPDAAGYILMAGLAQTWDTTIIRQFTYIMSIDGELDAEENAEIDKLKAQFNYLNSSEFSADSPSDSLPMGMSGYYWKFVKEYSPVKEAAKLKKPVLVLQGEADYQVTMRDHELWKKSFEKNSKAEFKSYPNLNHLFQLTKGKGTPTDYEKPGNIEKQVIDDIVNFIKKNN